MKLLIAEYEIIMDRLDAMALFVAVADRGSLAAAARQHGCSPASVTRAVARLETEAGQQLLVRSARRFAVTDAGAHHLLVYRMMLAEFAQLKEGHQSNDIQGDLVITAPELFGSLKVMPIVEDFLERYPGVRVRMLLLNRLVDLVSEGVDMAIRLAHLPDSALKAIKLGEVSRLTCAAPAYLANHPAPDTPADLISHLCIGLNESGGQELWRYRENRGQRKVRSVRVSCRLALNNAAAAIAAAQRGHGVVRALSYQVERHIAEGTLIPLLQPYETDPLPVHLVFQSGQFEGGAVRAFINFAVPLLRSGSSAEPTPSSMQADR